MFIWYFILVICIVFPLIAFYEESVRPGAILNNYYRKNIYKNGHLVDYLADDPTNQPYDIEVPLCDYKTITPKRFFNEYVRKGRPCLFKEYAKL